jgi:hypothetical protein
MPLTQPKRENSLMGHYFRVINMPGARLTRRCGVSHSQVYMARTRNVGVDNGMEPFANVKVGVDREKQVADSPIRTPPRKIRPGFVGTSIHRLRSTKV